MLNILFSQRVTVVASSNEGQKYKKLKSKGNCETQKNIKRYQLKKKKNKKRKIMKKIIWQGIFLFFF